MPPELLAGTVMRTNASTLSPPAKMLPPSVSFSEVIPAGHWASVR